MSTPANGTPTVDVLILGAGFGGLCMGIHLRKAGHESFLILERGSDVGGTWMVNTYPGCACDIPSHLYSYSFECSPDWTRMYPSQAEIWKYLQDCATKYGLYPKIRFGTEAREAVFEEAANRWRVCTSHGDAIYARVLVPAMGGLSRPALPAIPGLERFAGSAFHSSAWDPSFDARGKRVAVIGTGASAIQIVPQIAHLVEQLYVFQRTPPWIVPKPDRQIFASERALFRRVPGYMRAFRSLLYWRQELLGLGYVRKPERLKVLARWAGRHLQRSVPNPELRRRLTPDYHIGCKRVLISNDYYPAMCRSNVELVTDGIAEAREHVIVTRDGLERRVDALIYGTGFRATDHLSPLRIIGRGGTCLNEVWKAGGEAFRGVVVTGYPNLFFLIGPNSRVAHNSIVFMIEAQVHYIMQCLKLMRQRSVATIEVRPDVQERFNRDLQRRFKKTVYASGCKSWYIDPLGRNSILWPDFSSRYWVQMRRVKPHEYVIAVAK